MQCRASLTISSDLLDISGAFALFNASINITQDFITRHFPLARALTPPLLYYFFVEVHKEPACNKEMHPPSSLFTQSSSPIPQRQSTPSPIPNKTGRLKKSWETRGPARGIFQCSRGQTHLQARGATGCTTEHRYPTARAEPGQGLQEYTFSATLA